MFKRICWGTAMSVATYHVYLMPHTILLDKYRSEFAIHRLSKEVPVKKELLERFEEVMEDLKLPDDVRKLIQPFNVLGFNVLHAGILDPKYGGIVGFPTNFVYKDISTVPKSNIMMNFRYPDWESEAGKNFLDSLVLSKEAQKFVMAREILRLQNKEPKLNAYTLAGMIGIVFMTGSIIETLLSKAAPVSQSSTSKASEKVLKLQIRPTFYYSLYAGLFVIGICMWLAIKDLYSCKFDHENDEVLANLGTKYIQGGKEFYEKQLVRNIALRSLFKPECESMFTPYGNEKFFIRQKSVALIDRRNFFEAKLQSLQ